MSQKDSKTVTVNGSADDVLAFLRDVDNQSNWFPGNPESEVLERDADGRVAKARLVNDVKVAKDEFILNYTHGPDWMHWELEKPTSVQKMQQGTWTVVDAGDTCQATMELELETSLPMPGMLQRKILRDTVSGATKALTKQF